MITMLRALFLVVCVATLSPAALAGPAEQKLALELTRLTVPEDNYNAMIDQMMTSMVASMTGASGQTIDAPTLEKLKLVVRECVPYDEMLQWNAEIYGARFTSAELGDLIAFYKTPTGQKAAALMPEISAEVGTKLGPVLMQRMPAAMKKHGLQ